MKFDQLTLRIIAGITAFVSLGYCQFQYGNTSLAITISGILFIMANGKKPHQILLKPPN